RGQRADHRVERCDVVREAHTDAHGRTVREAGDVADAAHRLRDIAEARPRPIRPRLPEAGDADHDEARILRPQPLRPEAPLLETAGAEILDQDVALPREAADQILSL